MEITLGDLTQNDADLTREDAEMGGTVQEQVCRVCGCTWNNACAGGCWWVECDLCNQCDQNAKGGIKSV